MVEWFFLTIIICSIGICISNLLKRGVERSIPIGILLVVSFLYILGLFNVLHIGVYIIIVLAICSILYCIYLLITMKKKFFIDYITPGLMMYFALSAFICYVFLDRLLFHVDDLMHWGLSVKSMLLIDQIPTLNNSTVPNIKHAPFVTIFQYLWCKAYPSLREPNLYRALGILGILFTLPIFANVTWKRFYAAIWRGILIVASISIFCSNLFYGLQVDGTVGLICSFFLIELFYAKDDKYQVYVLALCLFGITLTKYTGMITSISLVAIVVIKYIFDYFAVRKNNESYKIKQKIKRIIIFFITIIIAFTSWYIFINVDEVKYEESLDYYQSEEALSIDKGFTNRYVDDEPSQYNNKEKFIKALLASYKKLIQIPNTENDTKLVDFGILITILLLIIFLYIGYKTKIIKSNNSIALMVGWITFFIGRLLIYTFGHAEVTAINAQGIERYLQTMNMAITIFVLYSFLGLNLCKRGKNGWSDKQVIIMLSKLFISVTFLYFANWNTLRDITINRSETANKTAITRENYSYTTSIVDGLDPDNDSVYVICSDIESSNANDYKYYLGTTDLHH